MAGSDTIPASAPMATISIDTQLQSGQQRLNMQAQHQQQTTSAQSPLPELQAPAFPGAKHDANGYCLRHSKIRLCQPLHADDGKGPIKYKALRKICPQCGVPSTAQQNTNRLIRKQSWHNRDTSKFNSRRDVQGEASGQQLAKTASLKRHDSGRSPDETNCQQIVKAVISKKQSSDSISASRKHHEDKCRGHQNSSSALNCENDKVRKDRLGEEKLKDGSRSKDRDKSGGRRVDRNDSKKNIVAAVNIDREKESRRKNGTREQSKAEQRVGRHRSSSHGQSKSKCAPDPEESFYINMKNRPDPEEFYVDDALKQQHTDVDIPLTRSPNLPKYSVIFSREEGGQLARDLAVPPLERETKGSNEMEHSERATGVFMMAARGSPLHDEVDKRNERDDKNDHPSSIRIKTSKAMDNHENEKGTQHGTAREQHQRSSNLVEEQQQQLKKASSNTDKDDNKMESNKMRVGSNTKVPARKGGNREADKTDFDKKLLQSHGNNEQEQPKKAPSNAKKGDNKPELLNKARESHDDMKSPSRKGSHKEAAKIDIKEERKNKKESSKDKPSSARPDPVKKLRQRSRGKAKEAKDEQQLRGSIRNNKDISSKRSIEKNRMDHDKVNGGHSQGNQNIAKERDSGKNIKDERVKRKESNSSGGSATNQRPAIHRGGQANNDEKGVRFRRGRSHTPEKRKKGDKDVGEKSNSDDICNSRGRRRQQQQNQMYQRSKSMPSSSRGGGGKRQQRKRVPVEYHLQQQPRHTSTLSNYRQTFLEEMAQMSVNDVPLEIERPATGPGIGAENT